MTENATPRRGRKRDAIDQLTPKQLQLMPFLIRHVEEYGFQPNCVELGEFLGITPPAVLARIRYLVEKGLLGQSKPNSERCVPLLGCKFLAYQVDEQGHPIEQVIEKDGFEFVVRRKA